MVLLNSWNEFVFIANSTGFYWTTSTLILQMKSGWSVRPHTIPHTMPHKLYTCILRFRAVFKCLKKHERKQYIQEGKNTFTHTRTHGAYNKFVYILCWNKNDLSDSRFNGHFDDAQNDWEAFQWFPQIRKDRSLNECWDRRFNDSLWRFAFNSKKNI